MNARPPRPHTDESRLIPLLAGVGFGFAIGVLVGFAVFG